MKGKKYLLTVLGMVFLLCVSLLIGCDDSGYEDYYTDTESEPETIELSFKEAVERYSDKREVLSYVEDEYYFSKLFYKTGGRHKDSHYDTAEIENKESYTLDELVDIYGKDAALDYYVDYIDTAELLARYGISSFSDLVDYVGENEAQDMYEDYELDEIW